MYYFIVSMFLPTSAGSIKSAPFLLFSCPFVGWDCYFGEFKASIVAAAAVNPVFRHHCQTV